MKFPRYLVFLAILALIGLAGLAYASNWGLAPAVRVGTGGLPASVVSADFNHDGMPDLVAVPNKKNGKIIFYPGKGNGKFSPRVMKKLTGDAVGNPVFIAMGDFNKDGNMDIAVAFFDNDSKKVPGKVEVFLGLDKGAIGTDGWPFTATPAVYPVGIRPISIAAADLNGDGILDLAVPNFGSGTTSSVGSISVLMGNGDGTFSPGGVFPAGNNPRAIVAADLNGDGVPDLAVTNMDKFSNTARVLFADTTTVNGQKLGKGSFTNFSTIQFQDAAMPWGIAAGDIDGDGATDLVVTEAGKKKVDVRFGNSSTTVLKANDGPDFVLVTDINQDGKPDLLVGEGGSNILSVYLNNGNRQFETKKDFIAGAFPLSIVATDLNRDGDPDIVTADNKSGALSIFLAKVTGKGTWGFATTAFDGTAQPWPKGLTAGAFSNATSVTADFNRDGTPDSAVLDRTNNAVIVSIAGAAGGPVSYPVGSGPAAIVAADINRDGNPDIAVANQGDGTVSFLAGNGDGTFQAKLEFAVGLFPASMAIGDFGDPNGFLDIAVSASAPPVPDNNPITVLFGQDQFSVTIQVNDTSLGGVVQVIDDTHTVPLPPGEYFFESGKDITLRAVPTDGNSFRGWSGSVTGTKTDITFTVRTKMTVKASFASGS